MILVVKEKKTSGKFHTIIRVGGFDLKGPKVMIERGGRAYIPAGVVHPVPKL